jgi:hypothetical protein
VVANTLTAAMRKGYARYLRRVISNLRGWDLGDGLSDPTLTKSDDLWWLSRKTYRLTAKIQREKLHRKTLALDAD